MAGGLQCVCVCNMFHAELTQRSYMHIFKTTCLEWFVCVKYVYLDTDSQDLYIRYHLFLQETG